MASHSPDVLWVVTTQWRAQATGYAGDPNVRTPALDALAAGSVNYAQAVTPHPFGPFARAALLTGVLSPENGVRDYFDSLPVASRTIAHLLSERGFETAFFGKWHLWKRNPLAPLVGEAQARIVVPPEARGGFGFWEGFEGGFQINNPWLHGTQLPEPQRFPGYQADVVCSHAANWLLGKDTASGKEVQKQRERKPRFCLVSLETPHPPYDAPAAGVELVDPAAISLAGNVPRGGEVEQKARRELAGYYAHIEATDRAIGRLLETTGNETVVVFTSVHGDMHGAHGLFRKGWPYEESVRIPLLVRLPGGLAKISDEAISLVDLPRLMRAYLDFGALPAIETEAAHISMPSVVRLPYQCDRVWRGQRSPTRKRIFDQGGSPWLEFDLSGDPDETTNLA